MNERKRFIYRNALHEIGAHDVLVIQSDDRHFGALHDDRGFLTFRHDRVLEYVKTDEELQVRLEYYKQNPPPIPDPRKVKPRNPDGLPEVCFTGFKADVKKELISLAAGKFHIASKVIQRLNFLVCGPNAGPSKVAKASAQGVDLIDEDEFRHMALQSDTGK